MTDLPEGHTLKRIDWDVTEDELYSYLRSGHLYIDMPPDPEPPSLEVLLAEAFYDAEPNNILDWYELTHEAQQYRVAVARQALSDLGLVCRDDIPTETLEPLSPSEFTLWAANSPWYTKQWHMTEEASEEWDEMVAALCARFGVPARPTVTQVMEALGASLASDRDVPWDTGRWEIVADLGRGSWARKTPWVNERLTAIGVRPDEEET